MYPLIASAYDVQYALWMMFTGMGGIFVFMAVFYLLIWALDKFFSRKEQ